ncbi:hypothetical protein [Nostoc sp. NMS4]|uniref:hypothetical protein n=1 Tax=Nostoc sp. NMS4 TaxID=2815390 RepID=UPI0025EA947B|nr:hypothetical protein [Nostoc sp. NMS4]
MIGHWALGIGNWALHYVILPHSPLPSDTGCSSSHIASGKDCRCPRLVHAISEEAKQFYEKCGFTPSPVAPMTLMVTVADPKAALG